MFKKAKIATYLLLISYSWFLPFFWMLTMLSVVTANEYSTLIGYLFTFYSLFLLKQTKWYQNINYASLLVIPAPVIFFVTGLFADSPIRVFLISPPSFVFFLTLITLFTKEIKLQSFGVMVVFIGYLHAFHIEQNSPFEYLTEENKSQINERNLNDDVNLKDFAFLDSKLDTIHFPLDKPVLIETWNEGCRPCMASIKDLEPIFDANPNIKHIYLYEALVKKRLKPEKIITFERIKNKSKILIDVEDNFLKTTEMKSYPYFMLFDKEGNLVDYFAGYSPQYADYFKERLKQMMKEVE